MIKKIEELSMNAFPALSTLFINGWILRFSKGYGKRANSVAPIYPATIDIEDNILFCEKAYKKAGLASVFKLTECDSNYAIDKLLEKKGYQYEAKTNILLKSLLGAELPQDAYNKNEESLNKIETHTSSEVKIFRSCQEEWFEAFVRMNKISEENKVTLKEILSSVLPDAFYGAYMEQDEILAVGLGVAERGYIGMFDILVNENHRRKGLGTKIMNALIEAGRAHGCEYSYLQVVDENEKAKNLYKKLGYEKQYSYWYRVKNI